MTNDILKKSGKRDSTELHFYCAKGVTFGVKKYSDILETIHDSKDHKLHHNHNLIEVHKDSKIAVFLNMQTKERVEKKFDALHLVPPQSPPKFIAESKLGDAHGYLQYLSYFY